MQELLITLAGLSLIAMVASGFWLFCATIYDTFNPPPSIELELSLHFKHLREKHLADIELTGDEAEKKRLREEIKFIDGTMDSMLSSFHHD